MSYRTLYFLKPRHTPKRGSHNFFFFALMHPSQLQIKDYTYELPDERIARYPLAERDLSKLLIYKEGNISEDVYRNLPAHLPADCMLVFNNTKVIEARILFHKSTGSIIEIFCLEPAAGVELTQAMMSQESVRWTCLVGGAGKWKQQFLEKQLTTPKGEVLLKAEKLKQEQGSFEIEFSWDNTHFTFAELLHFAGVLPLPPYLQRQTEAADYDRYQTVYARQEGSVAAPTAGLHFTPLLLQQLQEHGIKKQFVTLHVGAGTFQPVKSETMEQHNMHREWIEITTDTIEDLLKQLPNNIIAVGTTSLRSIESLYWMGVKAIVNPNAGIEELEVQQWDAYDLPKQEVSASVALQALLEWMKHHQLSQLICHTQILIAPGYKARIASAIITNFHQPNSTLLLLVAALIGNDWKKIYDHAMANNFRFLSYGDGSLLWVRESSV
ncbi:S-adenosylmethionine:tRNA ribosyltransferase-isomerase [Lacibacter sp.]|uniref:S-adenosylmethionine:tRNA ribosyltransferase-isomerase n=1 Tax=Lacibacter sp. TaxID=1915409 RepID=UPI002B4B76EE|nr:S-adenosylmethionine:tRNA ribosyltransferase-isomerase [Lacibacter sp.]HLP38308.1 S-adenosylmethionine:tRNA ribosyltransferase-isomerase [Lacibacter sp.]